MKKIVLFFITWCVLFYAEVWGQYTYSSERDITAKDDIVI